MIGNLLWNFETSERILAIITSSEADRVLSTHYFDHS